MTARLVVSLDEESCDNSKDHTLTYLVFHQDDSPSRGPDLHMVVRYDSTSDQRGMTLNSDLADPSTAGVARHKRHWYQRYGRLSKSIILISHLGGHNPSHKKTSVDPDPETEDFFQLPWNNCKVHVSRMNENADFVSGPEPWLRED